MPEKRSSVLRWLTFGPMSLPESKKARWEAALKNRANARAFGARVTKYGGPAAPGLYKHKTFTSQGSLMVRRGTRLVTVKRRDASAITKKSWATRKKKYGKAGRKAKNTFKKRKRG